MCTRWPAARTTAARTSVPRPGISSSPSRTRSMRRFQQTYGGSTKTTVCGRIGALYSDGDARGRLGLRSGGRGDRPRRDRQEDRERGPLTVPAAYRDAAPEAGGELLRDAEPEAGAAGLAGPPLVAPLAS